MALAISRNPFFRFLNKKGCPAMQGTEPFSFVFRLFLSSDELHTPSK
jgi:hypothetical protein